MRPDPGTQRTRVGSWRPALVILALLALWEISARAGWISRLFFPSPSSTLLTLFRMTISGALPMALGVTLSRLFVGVLIGSGVGLILGWLMGLSRPVRLAVEPIVAALHPLPKVAIFPIVLVVLGIGESSKIALVALTAFFPTVINTLAGVQQIDQTHWDAAANYGAKGVALVRRVILPGSLPLVLVGLKLALNTSFVVTIAVEMLSAQEGLGARIWLVWQTLRLQELYAVLLVIALLGSGIHRFFGFLAARLAPWDGRNDSGYL